MAYASLVSLSEILDKILKRDGGQYNIITDAEIQPIKSLHENIIFLEEFLEDFPEKAKSLEGRMRDVANESQDIIESFISNKIKSVNGRTKHLWLFILCFQNCLPTRHHEQSLYENLQKETKEIGCIVEEVIEMKKNARKEDELSIHSSSFSSSTRLAPPREDTMVGFDNDLLEIKERLCGSSAKLQIIPIVGMGGIGKTTLAKNAYEVRLIMQQFDVRAWVTVSQDYRAREILESLVRSMGASKEEIRENNDGLLQQKVYQTLKGRRYLIVMDDMWGTNVWDDVKRFFPDDYNGSKIMVTTRLSDVASYADDSSSLYKMQCMDENHSWNLLREKVFGQAHCPVEFEKVGKMIAKNCHGLPLAIVVVGGLLSKMNQRLHDWENVARNIRGVINEGDVAFGKILSLSYDHLPHHLKPCFLYLGGFPEDYEIRVSKLVKLWVAEGFLKPNEFKSLEDVAQDNLNDLVSRNLVLITDTCYNGKPRSVKIHDLLRDLCLTNSHEEKFFHHIGGSDERFRESNSELRRVGIRSNTWDVSSRSNFPSIRSILFFLNNGVNLLKWLKGFMLLRVLDTEGSQLTMFPLETNELFHLRFLAFTYYQRVGADNGDLEVPSSIANFRNLETLIIRSTLTLHLDALYLPVEIWRLRKLRHLILFEPSYLPDPEDDALPLINLQTLSYVANFAFTMSMIEMIPNLKKLGLFYSLLSSDWSKYQLNNLVHLHQLEKLYIGVHIFSCHPTLTRNFVSFPPNLKKLTLKGQKLISWEELVMIGTLPIEVLKLKNFACHGYDWETREGEFCKLKKLVIDQTYLVHWIVEGSTHFPMLEQLSLFRCNGLKEIPSEVGEIPTLQLIKLDRKNKSLIQSAKFILEEQRSFGNDVLQVLTVRSP